MKQLKIGIVSDLHAEFWSEPQFETIGGKVQRTLAEADLLLLAGDINLGTDSVRTARRLFPDKPVCLVAGNHEFYQRQHSYTIKVMRGVAEGTNVTFLQHEVFEAVINDQRLRVLGATFWTDFALFGTPELSMFDAMRGLNDYRMIRFDESGRLLTPADTLAWHHADHDWLMGEINRSFDGLTIVLLHHAPVSFASADRFIGDRLSPCFASRCEHDFMRDDIALVVWGHTHHSVDQTIGSTRFVSNQTGYATGRGTETGDYGLIVSL
jgi:predicted phosphodiesterase